VLRIFGPFKGSGLKLGHPEKYGSSGKNVRGKSPNSFARYWASPIFLGENKSGLSNPDPGSCRLASLAAGIMHIEFLEILDRRGICPEAVAL
jgi:hypothetical protein